MSLGVPAVSALEQPEYGGRSTDYHPPTRNPQGSSPTGLQPTGNNSVQPAPTGINPQALPRTQGLKVLTSPDNGASTTAPEASSSSVRSKYLLTWVIGGILTLAAVIYVIFKPDSKPEDKNEAPQEAPVILPAQAVNSPKKTRKTAKKKSGKKGKATRR